MIEAVIFDVDGTLIDSVDFHAEAWQKALAEFGKNIDFPDVRRQIGKGGDTFMPVFLSQTEIEDFGKSMEERRGKIFKEIYMPRVKPFPKVPELFRKILDEGKKIALASSAKEDELEKYKEIAGVSELIQAETSADDAERSKPHPDIFQAALKRLGNYPIENVIVIGDAPYDAEAAGKINLQTIGLLSGGFPEADLRRAGCIAIYKSAADLLENYENSPLAKDISKRNAGWSA